MMKDLVTPVAVDEIRNVVRKCLENAALINYTKVNEMAKNEGQTPVQQVIWAKLTWRATASVLSPGARNFVTKN